MVRSNGKGRVGGEFEKSVRGRSSEEVFSVRGRSAEEEGGANSAAS